MHRMYEDKLEEQEIYNELVGDVFSHSTLEQEAHDRGDELYIDLSSENEAISEMVTIIQMFPIDRQNHLLNAVYERLKHSRKTLIKETKQALKQML